MGRKVKKKKKKKREVKCELWIYLHTRATVLEAHIDDQKLVVCLVFL